MKDLIEKLEAAKLNPSSGMLAEGGNNAIYNQGIETAVAIVRQHRADNLGNLSPESLRLDKIAIDADKPSEIWDNELREKFLSLLAPVIRDGAILGMMGNALAAVAQKHYSKPVSLKEVAESASVRDEVAMWVLKAARVPFMGDVGSDAGQDLQNPDAGFSTGTSPATLQPDEETEEAVKELLERYYVYDKASGSRFFSISDAMEELRPYLRQPERESGELTEADKKEIVSAMDSAYRIAFLSNPTTNPFYAVLDAFLKWRKARV